MLITLPLSEWGRILQGVSPRCCAWRSRLIIAVAWTIPVGVLIGSNRRAANFLQPIIQVVASIPATALFPVIVLALVSVHGQSECARDHSDVAGHAVVHVVQCHRGHSGAFRKT